MSVPKPDTRKYLDLIQNAEPVGAAQLISIISAVILGYLDSVLHFTGDPLLSALFVAAVVNVVGAIWARARVWSPNSVAALLRGQGPSEGPPPGGA